MMALQFSEKRRAPALLRFGFPLALIASAVSPAWIFARTASAADSSLHSAMAAAAVLAGAIALVGSAFAWSWSLATEVDDAELRVRIRPIGSAKTVALGDVRGARAIERAPVSPFVFRAGPAVELDLADGTRLAVESARAAELVATLDRVRPAARATG